MSTYNLSYCREIPFVILLSLHFLSLPIFSQTNQTQVEFEKYYQKSQDDSLSIQTRIRLLKIAFESLKYTEADSLKYSRISKLVEESSKLKESLVFQSLAKEGMKLAQLLDNPSLIADAHWNYAAYYLKIKKYDRSYSHYDAAYKLFKLANNKYYAGKMIYNMAYISSQTNDFTGAEILLFRCIKIFEENDNYKQLYLCYNLLGTNADDMEEYEKALEYYNKAAELIPKTDNSHYYQLEQWNNLGVRLQKIGQYKNAVSYFDKALANKKILETEPTLLAKLLDNKAFSYMQLGNYVNVRPIMEKALHIRDSIEDSSGSTISRLRFAIFYSKIGDTLAAIHYAKEGLGLAEKNNLSRDILHSLEILANLDPLNRVIYLQRHITLNKIFNARDRNLRNKFTAIQYDTDKYISENERLFREKLWIGIGAIAVTFILLLIYLNTRQRAKNKELLFEREQQQYNEDMFLMAMENKTTLERGRSEERIRISKELHDGILARLFAIRFKWSFIELRGAYEKLEQHKQSINQLTDIETDIRNISHDLRNDLIWDELDFRHEIENALKDKSEIFNIKYTLSYTHAQEWEDLDYLYKINICRMLDEILQNIIRHAKATAIIASFKMENETFIITIADNGKGFKEQNIKKGIGLKNLTNRVRKLNGEIMLDSKIGLGTKVEIRFPKND